jgi:hypothetical protein
MIVTVLQVGVRQLQIASIGSPLPNVGVTWERGSGVRGGVRGWGAGLG